LRVGETVPITIKIRLYALYYMYAAILPRIYMSNIVIGTLILIIAVWLHQY
jgi:hypothetical protein